MLSQFVLSLNSKRDSARESPQPIAQKSEVETSGLSVARSVEDEKLNFHVNSDGTLDKLPSGDRAMQPAAETYAASIATADIPKLNEMELPIISAEALYPRENIRINSISRAPLVQISQSIVEVTGLRINQTPNGLEIILETGGQQLQTTTRVQGNTAIVNIPNSFYVLDGWKIYPHFMSQIN
ncbi:hypothetical protein QT970_02230 [Microcoleus sp. herbarium8]|uniref:hypothetical protein n=1 Tax=Microcoleus sp. herbarium8 TaxID=3055436 RepID=UPI002FCF9EEC